MRLDRSTKERLILFFREGKGGLEEQAEGGKNFLI